MKYFEENKLEQAPKPSSFKRQALIVSRYAVATNSIKFDGITPSRAV
jgi:hypothetical protein